MIRFAGLPERRYGPKDLSYLLLPARIGISRKLTPKAHPRFESSHCDVEHRYPKQLLKAGQFSTPNDVFSFHLVALVLSIICPKLRY